mmetsp:Transcript_24738/g.38518  ORF Transcript_24738/g.38518 Transcript_24738/m.38518 type:complete len:91 (+) Transcript_24738:154-426(+)
MKKFYGKHLVKYMGPTIPDIDDKVRSIKGLYAPLQQISYSNDRSKSAGGPRAKARAFATQQQQEQLLNQPKQTHMNVLMKENRSLQDKLD